MKTATLDALIPREDFEVTEELSVGVNRNKTTLSIEDLQYDSFFFTALRKPEFQRETNEWSPEKVCSFIKSFINGELVPAIILWKNQNGFIFVIDGAHRLSSLGAWINDDYGDGDISLKYYDRFIPDEQRSIAQKTRELVNTSIGSFKELKDARRKNPKEVSEEVSKIVNNLGSLALQVQWVEGDSSTAEDSFLKINQSATKISDAELELIISRNKAHAISARAIVRAGRGHKYWSEFDDKSQGEILSLANQIHELLFGNKKVSMDEINVLPIGGPFSSSYTLDTVTQTVKICNNLLKESDEEDGNAETVIKYLKKTLRILEYIASKKPYSLGLHPFVYFYSDLGKHKVGSFYGILELLGKLTNNKQLNKFIEVREVFEETLMTHNFIVQQIIRRWRQSKKGYREVAEYFSNLIDIIYRYKLTKPRDVIDKLKELSDYRYLQTDIVDNEATSIKRNFSRGQKQQIKIQALIQNIPRCPICKGYVSPATGSIDHIMRKEDGGTVALSNGQLTHLYCNTTYKN
ncbi:GmrSD restriction endonuclease domain-containing protein [Brevibacillus laterosporus]|uniref:GmrSD restriction endonuclease domain-containing protein n=1 Tax=Brevibacillus laterosporus TaxID=1465 RepID=UPI003D1EB76B